MVFDMGPGLFKLRCLLWRVSRHCVEMRGEIVKILLDLFRFNQSAPSHEAHGIDACGYSGTPPFDKKPLIHGLTFRADFDNRTIAEAEAGVIPLGGGAA